uniref:Huntingtin interacting protein K n=1 Tax=Chelonoidis abingdonii TaxID=106734 RepID=A0A8C0IQH9_CHEAB
GQRRGTGDVELELETSRTGRGRRGRAGGRPAEKPRKHDSGAADLERSSNLETVRAEGQGAGPQEKELAKVTIKKEDLELIMNEMEISRAAAERSLREHMGNVVEALITLTN